ncbi:MAG: hypothetical protein MUE68_13335 [Bacteroidetes bacterium]|jgi:hypothetical protein|nr:hypothetical protein [Bacteroidota bacterium]
MSATFSSLFPNVAELLNDGCVLEIHGGGRGLKVASICDGRDVAYMFRSSGKGADEILRHLELLAGRYVSEAIITDEVNGEEYCIG